jgi:hypothetical protein
MVFFSLLQSDLGPPDREFCPLVPSDAPTTMPDTPAPSPFPSSSPTAMPVIDPTPPPVPAPTPMPTMFSMSMSFSMSMDLRFADLWDTMNDIKEDAAQEFGRDPVIMDKLGIRGSRAQQSRPRNLGKTRNDDVPNTTGDVECDDFPCDGATTPEDAFKDADVSATKSAKATKSSKSTKNEKKEKITSKKDTTKLVKGQGDARMLSPLFDTFGRDDQVEEEQYTYNMRR